MRITAIVIAIVVSSSAAHAGDDKPWARGVPAAEQERALALYQDANNDFAESRYTPALAKYREALAHWDHPAIHFNMAVALIQVDQPLEAYEHLEASMRYGAGALGDAMYAKAVEYEKQIAAKTARLRVTSDIDEVDVTVDGKLLLHGRGEATQRVLPGAHQIVATKAGFVPQTETVALSAGEQRDQAIELVPLPSATNGERSVASAPPPSPSRSARPAWIVCAAGGALAAVGLALNVTWYKHARDVLAVDGNAGDSKQYAADEPAYDHSREAVVGLYIAGGIAVATGIALRYTVFRDRSTPTVGLAPMPAGGMISIAWQR